MPQENDTKQGGDSSALSDSQCSTIFKFVDPLLIAKAMDGKKRSDLSTHEDAMLEKLLDHGFVRIRNGEIFIP